MKIIKIIAFCIAISFLLTAVSIPGIKTVGLIPIKGKILVYSMENGTGNLYDRDWFDDDLPVILWDYGYMTTVVDRKMTPTITAEMLEGFDELWFLSTLEGSPGALFESEITAIINFTENGKGLLIMSDHDAYRRDANLISGYFGVMFNGTRNHGLEIFIDKNFSHHFLFFNVTSIAGSISEGDMTVNPPAEVVAKYNEDNLTAVLDSGNVRIVFEVSIPRLFDQEKNPLGDNILVGDTSQYVKNIADWLMRLECLPSIVYVDDDYTPATPGWGFDHFDVIQDGIDAVQDGGTVYVYDGAYYENVVVNKSISLIGEDRDTTIIDANETGYVIYVSSNCSNISGFTIQNGAKNWGPGVWLNYSGGNTIRDNVFTNNSNGIYLCESDNNIINDNDISYSCYHGLQCDQGSNNNNISQNHFTYNNVGINVTYSKNNILYKNTIKNEGGAEAGYGIDITSHGDDNIVTQNIISSNPVGIHFNDGTIGNHVYHNSFTGNLQNTDTYIWDYNLWDNGYPSGGNYWSDYTGWDIYQGPNQDIPGGDGIGDTPYNITGDSNQDQYPLMHPYSEGSNVYFQGMEPMYTTEYIEVAVTIDPNEAIAGVQFDMSFDPDMLSVDWVAEGDIFSGYDTYFDGGVIDNINGTLKNVVSLITTPNGSTTDQGSIAIVAIRAKTAPGETPLNLTNVIVGRPDATPIKVTIINTSVTIQYRVDLNGDGNVNILDLILIGQHWMETGPPCWIPAEVNGDGVVNILDMILVGQHWTG